LHFVLNKLKLLSWTRATSRHGFLIRVFALQHAVTYILNFSVWRDCCIITKRPQD